MTIKFFGALMFTGVDGVGLPVIEHILPAMAHQMDFPLRRGSESDLRAAAERTEADLRAAGWGVQVWVKEHAGQRAAMHSAYEAVVRAEGMR